MNYEIKGRKLYFTNTFNEMLYNYIYLIKKNNIIEIYLGDDFNKSIDCLNNVDIKTIIFSKFSEFNQPIDNLPYNLINLTMGWCFNQKINNSQNTFSRAKNKFINKKNKSWLIKSCYLPNSLKSLNFFKDLSVFNQEIDILPSNLENLVLSSYFNLSVNNLPNNLKYLSLGSNFNLSKINNLPLKLKYLDIYRCKNIYEYKQQLDEIIPKSAIIIF